MHTLQKDYWSNKADLTDCVNQKEFKLSNESVRTSNLSLVNYYKHQLSIQSQAVVRCMKKTSKDFLVNRNFTLNDIHDILHLTKNTIPVKSEYFSSKNNIRVCNEQLDHCQKQNSETQTKYLKLLTTNVEDYMILGHKDLKLPTNEGPNPTSKPITPKL